VEIAISLQDATPTTITFGILPGWRAEEVAASLATSGLHVTGQDLLDVIHDPSTISLPAGLGPLNSLEGFLFPALYEFPREIILPDMVDQILVKFVEVVTPEMMQGFSAQGLTLQQAVTLASIVQREAMHEDEMPMISAVFYNRLALGMKLDSDPTVQYALGYSNEQQSWWKNQLTALDLQIDSPYNTYLYPGLPPSPICNPSLAALEAVAYPAESEFLYFRSSCDGSGYHNFASTYEDHLANSCP
jgi:UPF0755 protein